MAFEICGRLCLYVRCVESGTRGCRQVLEVPASGQLACRPRAFALHAPPSCVPRTTEVHLRVRRKRGRTSYVTPSAWRRPDRSWLRRTSRRSNGRFRGVLRERAVHLIELSALNKQDARHSGRCRGMACGFEACPDDSASAGASARAVWGVLATRKQATADVTAEWISMHEKRTVHLTACIAA